MTNEKPKKMYKIDRRLEDKALRDAGLVHTRITRFFKATSFRLL